MPRRLRPRSLRRAAGGAAFLLLVLSACEASPRSDDGPARGDSAGVEIVRHGVLADSPTVPVESLLILGDGPGQGGVEFASIGDAGFLEDGRIAVLDRGNARICLFFASGNLDNCIGREGEGPGEFSGALTLAVLPLSGGGFAVPDAGNGRITVFDKDGVVEQSLPLSMDDGFVPEWRGVPGGVITFRRVTASREMIVRGSLHGGDQSEVVSLPRIVHGPESGDGRWPLLADWWSWDADPHGRVVVARTSEASIQVYQGGRAVRVLSWDAPRVPPTREEVEALLLVAARGAGSADHVPPEIRSSMAAPAWMPPVAAARWGPDGSILVQQVRPTGDMDQRVLSTMRSEGRGGPTWWVFREDGWFAGFLRFDANVEIFRVHGDTLIGAREDPSGVIQPFVAPWPKGLDVRPSPHREGGG
jgi:hypothetical protein